MRPYNTDQIATLHYGGSSLTGGGVQLSEMPVVTVEQITRFREAALTVEQQRDKMHLDIYQIRAETMEVLCLIRDGEMTADEVISCMKAIAKAGDKI